MSELDNFLELMRLNRKKSPWSKERTFAEMAEELRKEVLELQEEEDPDKIRGELGDVLMDTFSLIAIAEEKGWFTSDEMCKRGQEKLLRRKPWIHEDHNLTPEEEVERWLAAKAKE